MGRLDDEIAILTGAAGSIGAASARRFVAEGTRVVLGDLQPAPLLDRVLRINVRGPFLLAKHALGAMRDDGSMIITSSVVGLTSDPGIAAYATSKHAVVGLMRTAAKEVAPRGIRVNTLHSGPVDNEFQHAVEQQANGQSRADAERFFNTMIPLNRHADAAEVAAAALYLASDESAFLTGATIPLDGGMSV